MKTFREVLGTPFKERRSVVGSFAPFKRDVYKHTYLDPHKEMQQNWEAYMYNSLVNAALNQLARFIFGNELQIKSDDENTSIFLRKYLDQRDFDDQLNDAILKTLICGNGYLEIDFDANTLIPDKFYSVADPSRMYVNFDKYGNPRDDDEAFLQRVDPIYNESDARWYELSYHIGYSYHKIRIKAIPINMEKIVHFKINKSINDVYGRANITSSLNDNEALQEIEKAIAMIVKYKAVPKKLIQYGDAENPTSPEEMDDLQDYLDNLEMEENAIINKPFAMQDLSYAGKEVNMDYMIKHMRKKIIAGTAPEFLLGMGDEVNRATAHEQLVAFIMSVDSDRKSFTNLIEQRILKPIIKHYNLDPNTWVEFGELDFESLAEKTTRVSTLWTNNLINLNEARELVGKDMIDGGDDIYYAQWVQQLGMESAPKAPEGAKFPKPDEGQPTADKGYEPTENPKIAGYQYSESADLNGTNYLEFQFHRAIKTYYVQAQEELLRDLNNFKESLVEKKSVDVLLDRVEGIVRPYMNTALKNAFMKGYKESGRILRAGNEPVRDNAIKDLKKYSFRSIKTLNQKQKLELNKILKQYFEEKRPLGLIQQEIKKRFNLLPYEATRIVRTEVNRFHAKGVKQAIKQSKLTNSYRWVTWVTENTGDLDKALNGKVFEMGAKGRIKVQGTKKSYDLPANPMPVTNTHPNCKCTIVPNIEL